MQQPPLRETVDLSTYPDLVVMLLGLKLRSIRALPAFIDIGKGLASISRTPPDGMLTSDQFMFGWNHVGIRCYWRDLPSLEAFTRQAPHSVWWKSFLKNPNDCGFWHETYSSRGGMEAIYIDLPEGTGFGRFAPIRPPVGSYMSSSERLRSDAAQRA